MRRDHARPSALDEALEAEVRQQGEYDIRRRPLFEDATRRQAAVYEEKSFHDSMTHVRFLPSVQEPSDGLSNIAAWERRPVNGDESDEFLRAEHRVELAGQPMAGQFRGVMAPFASGPDLTSTVAAHGGLVEGVKHSKSTWPMGTAIGKERNDFSTQNIPDEAVNNPIAQRALRYTAPLDGQREQIASARDTLAHDAGITKALVDTLTSNQVHRQSETGADERDFLQDTFRGRGRDHGFGSPPIAYPGAQAAIMITNDLVHNGLDGASAIGSVLGGFGATIGQGERRANHGSLHPIFDRHDHE
jgi:hypothetical protein